MRVGLVIYGSLDTLSGGYLYDRKLMAYLLAQGDSAEIVSQSWSSYPRHLLHNLDGRLAQRLHSAEIDVLLQDELNHPSLFLLNRWLRPRVAYPIVSIVHHLRSSEHRPAWQNHAYRGVERRYLHSVDGFIFNSATTQAAVAELRPSLPPHVIATPAGNHLAQPISAERVSQRAHEGGPLRVLFVGNVAPRKGLHVLLAALARLPESDWQLAIVGDTSGDPDYVRRCRELVQTDNVTWLGRVSDAQLAELYAESHLLCVPSSYEGFGIVYLEAMAHGLPVVATTAGAAPEVVDVSSGCLVPPEDAAALATCLGELMAHREKVADLGRGALLRAKQFPDWDASMARVRQFLLTLTQ